MKSGRGHIHVRLFARDQIGCGSEHYAVFVVIAITIVSNRQCRPLPITFRVDTGSQDEATERVSRTV